MSVSVSRAKASRSVAVKAKLDYPVIDTDLHTIEYTPLLEDYIAKYGGNKLVDDFRKAVENSEANPRFFEGTAVEARLNADGGVKAAE